jgi:hypothetical protein
MSIAAMTSRAAAVTNSSASTASTDPVSSALALIATYIPTEVVGGYVAVGGVLAMIDKNPWAIWWVFTVLTPIYTATSFLGRPASKDEKGKTDYGKLVLLIIFALIGYVIWTAALPGTPFQQFFVDEKTALTIGGAAVIIVAPLLAAFAAVLKLR